MVDQTGSDSRNPNEDVQERAGFGDQLLMLGCCQIGEGRDLLARGSDGVIRFARDLPKPAGEERSDREKNQQEYG
ncbi:MAG: hypothetical protein ACJ8DG_11055 [Microvirga sp.]